jgi:hypothetical protein
MTPVLAPKPQVCSLAPAIPLMSHLTELLIFFCGDGCKYTSPAGFGAARLQEWE